STSRYLHLLDGPLRKLQETHGIEVRVIGDASFAIEGAFVRATDWRLESEVEDLAELDIGVYPLPDEEWVLGKSGLKALQDMALGVATIAQRTPVNEGIIEHGVNGFLVDGLASWESTVGQLITSERLRASVAEAARRTVEERYSVRVTTPEYLRVLDSALASRPRGRL